MMNQQEIFKKVGHILTELNEQYQFLAQHTEQLNDLELELFLANADFLADHVRIVQKLNHVKPSADLSVQTLSSDGASLPQDDIVADKSYKEDEECFDPAELEEVVTAEEEEERVDLKPQEEIIAEENIREETAAAVLENDFFKPDQDQHSFEFVLGQHNADDQFDYEAKSVEDIFDRPLSQEEEEILAHKKRIHAQDESSSATGAVPSEEDEVGPEPFLMPHEEAQVDVEKPIEEPEPLKVQASSQPIEALRDVEMDESIISPPVKEERPVFTPEAVPVRPLTQNISSTPAPSLNDLLAKTHARTDEPVKAPIADLKQGVSLNEKLLFIKDLFKGYNLAYSEAIDIINKMNSFEAADSFLQSNYAVKNDWASKQSTVDQFYELLNRRFKV